MLFVVLKLLKAYSQFCDISVALAFCQVLCADVLLITTYCVSVESVNVIIMATSMWIFIPLPAVIVREHRPFEFYLSGCLLTRVGLIHTSDSGNIGTKLNIAESVASVGLCQLWCWENIT